MKSGHPTYGLRYREPIIAKMTSYNIVADLGILQSTIMNIVTTSSTIIIGLHQFNYIDLVETALTYYKSFRTESTTTQTRK